MTLPPITEIPLSRSVALVELPNCSIAYATVELEVLVGF